MNRPAAPANSLMIGKRRMTHLSAPHPARRAAGGARPIQTTAGGSANRAAPSPPDATIGTDEAISISRGHVGFSPRSRRQRRKSRGSPRRHLHVNTSIAFAVHQLAPALPEFLMRYRAARPTRLRNCHRRSGHDLRPLRQRETTSLDCVLYEVVRARKPSHARGSVAAAGQFDVGPA